MSQAEWELAPQGLSEEELEAEQAVELPDREALSVVGPHAGWGLLHLHPPHWVTGPAPAAPVEPPEPVEAG
jgi:hypothetical protein